MAAEKDKAVAEEEAVEAAARQEAMEAAHLVAQEKKKADEVEKARLAEIEKKTGAALCLCVSALACASAYNLYRAAG